jgi:serine protease Do
MVKQNIYYLLILILCLFLYFLIERTSENFNLFSLFNDNNSNTSSNSILNSNNSNTININQHDINKFFDETVVRIRCQYSDFNWIEPYIVGTYKESIGTGFFIDLEGHLLTNFHVIDQSIINYIQIPKYGNKTFNCDIISIYPDLDLALLKIKNFKNKKYLKMGNSNKIRRGIESYVVGFPLGQDKYKITSGIISGYQDGDIQTDSPINRGNSGGPLVDENINVIGINYAGYDDAQNVGYAIPINYVKYILDDMKVNKIIKKPVFGASFNNTNESIMKFTKLCTAGYYISFVAENGPFHKVGIKEGSIICSVDGMKIDNYGEIFIDEINAKFYIGDYLRFKKVGDSMDLEIIENKGGDNYEVVNKQIRLEGEDFYKIKYIYNGFEDIDYQVIGGMIIMELSNNHLKEFEESKHIQVYKNIHNKLEKKLIITKVLNGSNLSEFHVFSAPIILDEVNDIKVSCLKSLRKALLQYKRDNGDNYITFKTENFKYFTLSLKKILEEELFLSKNLNYKLSEFTKKLIKIENIVENKVNNQVNYKKAPS